MYQKLLVPLDGSELAEAALPYAEDLASKLGSEIVLINVRPSEKGQDNPEHQLYLSNKAEMIKQESSRFPDKSSGIGPVKVSSLLLFGQPAEEIVDYAEKENVSLIVMATHGRSGIKRWALGSVADKVVRTFRCPVLLIRANIDIPRKVKLASLLVPLDGSEKSEAVLAHVEALAAGLGARVILLHVIVQPYQVYAYFEGVVEVAYTDEELKIRKSDAGAYLEKVSSRLKAKGVNSVIEIREGEVHQEIIKFAGEVGADMVAMSTHGRSGLNRWEHGSNTDKVLHAVDTPLLLVRPREALDLGNPCSPPDNSGKRGR